MTPETFAPSGERPLYLKVVKGRHLGSEWDGGGRDVNVSPAVLPPHPLPLPLGEVAERSEDGEGKRRSFDLTIQKKLRGPLSHLR